MVSTRRPTFDTSDTLRVESWPDPIIDQHGVDPRSDYVEQVWLGVLGPSTVWLLRRLAHELDDSPLGFELDLATTALSLGLGGTGRSGSLMRSLGRACQFGMARAIDGQTLQVRRRLPPATQSQLRKLPDRARDVHDEWMQSRLVRPSSTKLQEHATRLAETLELLGESADVVEAQLRRWRFHPALAHEVAHRNRPEPTDGQNVRASSTNSLTP